jgi:hypothetical protein
MYTLEPMSVAEIQQLIGPAFITNFQKEVDEFMTPMRKHIEMGRPLSMGKETWEYAVADSIEGSTWAGAGNSIVDVKIDDDVGLDVKGVGKGGFLKKTKEYTKSGEASMYQTYEGDTDTSFSTKDSDLLWKTFIEGWSNKTKTVKNYYLLVIYKDKNYNCSICGFKRAGDLPKFDPNLSSFTTDTGKPSAKNWRVEQLADPKLLSTVVVRNKKRLEMRLRPPMYGSAYSLPVYKF